MTAEMREGLDRTFLRRVNTAKVFHALRENPDISQRDLVERTSIDKATISTIIKQLEARGLVERLSSAEKGRVGRPGDRIRISPRAGLLAGVRLEPDSIQIITTTLEGKVVGTGRYEVSRDIGQVLEGIDHGVKEVVERSARSLAEVRAVGIGIPALTDSRGSVEWHPTLGWRNIALRELCQERFRCPVFLDNDTNAAAVAERLFGCCGTVDDFVFLMLGASGIGGALYLGGALYRGPGGMAGELGHVKVVPNGRLCDCGGQGCLSAYLSGSAVKGRLAQLEVSIDDTQSVAALAVSGDPRVLMVLEEAGEQLGQIMAIITNSITPSLIVLGGEVAELSRFLLPRAEKRRQQDSLSLLFEHTKIAVSALGVDSVAMGGVALAMEGAFSLPEWMSRGPERWLRGASSSAGETQGHKGP